jgi:hypothetical protein
MSGEPLDLSSEPAAESSGRKGDDRRPFLGIHFACCGIYSRIYTTASGSAFAGNCPRCGRRIEVGISPDGQDGRFFSAY